MGAVLEKITLYDILGYLLPGSVLMILMSYGAERAGMSIDPGWWSDSEGFGYFVFFCKGQSIYCIMKFNQNKILL